MDRADTCIRRILTHEGGWANDPRDPGGATNLGVTIGTLKRLGMDLDGDGDTDIADLRQLEVEDAVRVYRHFYWNKVEADLLPVGVDYATADFAVNSGVQRASRYLQRVVGAKQDGDVGPKTLAAVEAMDPEQIVRELCDARMAFLRGLSHWNTYGNGWTRRVSDVEDDALSDMRSQRAPEPHKPTPATPAPSKRPVGLWASLMAALRSLFGKA